MDTTLATSLLLMAIVVLTIEQAGGHSGPQLNSGHNRAMVMTKAMQ